MPLFSPSLLHAKKKKQKKNQMVKINITFLSPFHIYLGKPTSLPVIQVTTANAYDQYYYFLEKTFSYVSERKKEILPSKTVQWEKKKKKNKTKTNSKQVLISQ